MWVLPGAGPVRVADQDKVGGFPAMADRLTFAVDRVVLDSFWHGQRQQ